MLFHLLAQMLNPANLTEPGPLVSEIMSVIFIDTYTAGKSSGGKPEGILVYNVLTKCQAAKGQPATVFW